MVSLEPDDHQQGTEEQQYFPQRRKDTSEISRCFQFILRPSHRTDKPDRALCTNVVLPPGARGHHCANWYHPQYGSILNQWPHHKAGYLCRYRCQINDYFNRTASFFRRPRQQTEYARDAAQTIGDHGRFDGVQFG